MEIALGIALGLGLSAACGFRVFVPLLVLSVAGNTGYLVLASELDWLATPAALLALSLATAVEIGAYFIPWLDNLLDSVASPAAVIAGVVASASVMTDVEPFFQWSIAVIAGGGIASLTQASTVVVRAASTVASGGLGNPLVSAAEAAGAVGLSLVAIVAPILGAILVLVVLIAGGGFLWQRFGRVRPVPTNLGEAASKL